jgi:antitoxin component HigA of HigAB toxin-antitoxin module
MKKQVTLDEAALAEIKKMFADLPSVDEVSIQIQADLTDFEKDPKFVAEFLKMQFVEDIYRIMAQQGLKPIQLAEKLGKSRQYVSRILNEKANFTFETVAAVTCALDARVAARMYTAGERMAILPLVVKPSLLVLQDFLPEKQDLGSEIGGKDAGNLAA